MTCNFFVYWTGKQSRNSVQKGLSTQKYIKLEMTCGVWQGTT